MAAAENETADVYILNIGKFRGVSGLPSVLLQYEGEKVAVRDQHGKVMGHYIKRPDSRTSSVDFFGRHRFTDEEVKDVPTVLYFQRSDRSSFGDFATQSSALILSGKAAAILQQIEPGKHQYFPLKVKAAKRYQDKLQAMGHVVVNVYQTAQVVDLERSRLKTDNFVPPPPTPPRTWHYLLDTWPDNSVVVDPTKAKGLHLWGGGVEGFNWVLYHQLFVSRALKEAWGAAGCGPVGYIPCRNV